MSFPSKVVIAAFLVAAGSLSSAAQEIHQKTDGRCSPTFAGVSGDIKVTITCNDQSDPTILRLNATIEEANRAVRSMLSMNGLSNRKDEIIFWQAIQDSSDPSEFTMYLRRYPRGIFAELARSRIERLNSSVDAQGFALRPDGQRICQTTHPQPSGACGPTGCAIGPGAACGSTGCVMGGGSDETRCLLATGQWMDVTPWRGR